MINTKSQMDYLLENFYSLVRVKDKKLTTLGRLKQIFKPEKEVLKSNNEINLEPLLTLSYEEGEIKYLPIVLQEWERYKKIVDISRKIEYMLSIEGLLSKEQFLSLSEKYEFQLKATTNKFYHIVLNSENKLHIGEEQYDLTGLQMSQENLEKFFSLLKDLVVYLKLL